MPGAARLRFCLLTRWSLLVEKYWVSPFQLEMADCKPVLELQELEKQESCWAQNPGVTQNRKTHQTLHGLELFYLRWMSKDIGQLTFLSRENSLLFFHRIYHWCIPIFGQHLGWSFSPGPPGFVPPCLWASGPPVGSVCGDIWKDLEAPWRAGGFFDPKKVVVVSRDCATCQLGSYVVFLNYGSGAPNSTNVQSFEEGPK